MLNSDTVTTIHKFERKHWASPFMAFFHDTSFLGSCTLTRVVVACKLLTRPGGTGFPQKILEIDILKT